MKKYKIIEYEGRKIKMVPNYAVQLINLGKAKEINEDENPLGAIKETVKRPKREK